MQAVMNLMVVVSGARQAQAALAGVAASTQAVNRTSAAGAAGANKLNAASFGVSRGLERLGKNTQWVGRQIEYNFTLPVALATGFTTKWALENERAMTRMRKVYGDSAGDAEVYREEIEQLGEAFRVLSDLFGVHQDEVIETGATWAQAGAEGIAVARGVKNSIELAILGEMDLAKATEALIAIQAQFGLSTADLTQEIAYLNAIENETSVNLQDLVTALQRGAGTAREAGVSIREFAAMTASLVPAAGTASQAGNSLRTMISRVMAPTRQAIDLFHELGLEVDTTGWHSKNFIERLHDISGALDDVTQSQRNQALSIIGSRWQVSRLSVLLRDLVNENGRYQTALEATSDAEEAMARYRKEIEIFLRSTPQGFTILTNQIRNLGTEIIQDFLPAMLTVLGQVRNWVRAFADLDPKIRNTIVGMVLLLAIIGPVIRYLGATILLVSQLAKLLPFLGAAFTFLLAPIKFVVSALGAFVAWLWKDVAVKLVAFATGLSAWWLIAFVAAAGVIWHFRDEIWEWVSSIGDAFNRLPEGIQNGLMAVVRTVRAAALQVYEWLSYLNPFVRHSPSLVESVQAGVAIISREYAKLANVGTVFASGLRALERFKAAVASARRDMNATERAQMRQDVTTVAPGSGGAFDAMVRSLVDLEAALARVERQYAAQDRVVSALKGKLDALNESLRAETRILDDLQKKAADARDALSDAETVLSELESTPIKGMRAYNDALFENEMAQKRLRLEILKMEEAEGPVDELRKKFAALQGDIEMLSGKRNDLRLGGAGSDVLGVYDQQIEGMRAAQRAMGDLDSPMGSEKLKDELEELQREAEKLQLEYDIEFDPLTRQLERLTDGYRELPFNELAARLTEQYDLVQNLTKEYEKSQAAVDQQQDIVDAIQRRVDDTELAYDREMAKLEELGNAYDGIADTIREMEAELTGFARDAAAVIAEAERAKKAAEDAKKKGAGSDVPQAIEDFRNSAGDFDIPGGEFGLGREEGDILAEVEKWQDEFGHLWEGFDMFGPIKEKWNEVSEWIRGKWGEFTDWWAERTGGLTWSDIFSMDTLRGIWDSIDDLISNSRLGGVWESIKDTVATLWDYLKMVFEWVAGPAAEYWNMFAEAVGGMFETVVREIGLLWANIEDNIGPLLESWGGFIGGLVKMVAGIATAIWAVLTSLWEGLIPIMQAVWDFIGDAFASLVQMVRGIIEVIISVFTGDWGGVMDALATIGDAMWDFFMSVLHFVDDIVVALVQGVVDAFESLWRKAKVPFQKLWQWLQDLWNGIYDWLVGNSIVPDIVNAIVGWFERLWDRAVTIWTNIKSAITEPIKAAWDWIVATWNAIGTWLSEKWTTIKATASTAWDLLRQSVQDKIEAVRTRIQNVVADVVTWLATRWASIRDTASRIWEGVRSAIDDKIEAVKTLIRNGVDAVGRMWNELKEKLRTPIAWAVDNVINRFIRGVNNIAGAVGLGVTLSEITIPQFHRGGVVGEAGDPRNLGRHPLRPDEQLAVLRNGERVLTKDERDSFEMGGPMDFVRGVVDKAADLAAAAARTAREAIANVVRPMVEGALGSLANLPGGGSMMGQMVTGIARTLGNKVLDWIGGVEGSIPEAPDLGQAAGWRQMGKAAQFEFPWARITSGARPGDPGYHGLGRAVDLAGRGFMNHKDMLSINKWIAGNYASATKELIYSGAGGVNLKNGRPFRYGNAVRADHFDHVHWAMDNGGFLNNGWNAPVYKGISEPEFVSPESLMRSIVREEVRSLETGGAGGRTVNLYGDLVLPNITSGDDADELIRNLERLAD